MYKQEFYGRTALTRIMDDFNRAWGMLQEAARQNYRGLLVVGAENVERMIPLNGDSLLRTYGDPCLLYSNRVIELFREMSCRDGAIVFDSSGNLLGAELFIQDVRLQSENDLEDIIKVKGAVGARHITGLYASTLFRYAICVGQQGIVIPFKNGKLVKELVCKPDN